ncbi:hypothetical protein ADUPG1_005751, partial [Aduncisulcus paluster]
LQRLRELEEEEKKMRDKEDELKNKQLQLEQQRVKIEQQKRDQQESIASLSTLSTQPSSIGKTLHIPQVSSAPSNGSSSIKTQQQAFIGSPQTPQTLPSITSTLS